MILSPPKLLSKVIRDILRNKQHRLLILSSFFLSPLMFAKLKKIIQAGHIWGATCCYTTFGNSSNYFGSQARLALGTVTPSGTPRGKPWVIQGIGGFSVTRCDIRGPCNNRDNKTSPWHRNQHRPNTWGQGAKVHQTWRLVTSSLQLNFVVFLPSELSSKPQKYVQWKTWAVTVQNLKETNMKHHETSWNTCGISMFVSNMKTPHSTSASRRQWLSSSTKDSGT